MFTDLESGIEKVFSDMKKFSRIGIRVWDVTSEKIYSDPRKVFTHPRKVSGYAVKASHTWSNMTSN